MAYVKQVWKNLPSTDTPVSAERLNYMESGIAEAWEQHMEQEMALQHLIYLI